MRVLSSVLVAAFVATSSAALTSEEYEGLFTTFVAQHKKSYPMEEFFSRFAIFKENVNFVRAHNAKAQKDFTMAINEFADLTAAEFKSLKTGFSLPEEKYLKSMRRQHPEESVQANPASVDWTTKGVVTPVKNQAQCGSCWAFSTTGAVEGAWAVAGHALVSLSEQQLVDCDRAIFGNKGCNGGLMDTAFKYIIKNGICTEDSYPYKGVDGTCNTSCTKSPVSISSYLDVPTGDEATLENFAALAPVAVAIEADQAAFQFYSSGVLTGTCGTNLDHGVLVVGYGTDSASGQNFWKVKNSWGPTWGEAGYVRIQKGTNKCGIALSASRPIV